jgi:hypothetical protein
VHAEKQQRQHMHMQSQHVHTPRAMQMALTAWLMQLLPMVSMAGAGFSLQV